MDRTEILYRLTNNEKDAVIRAFTDYYTEGIAIIGRDSLSAQIAQSNLTGTKIYKNLFLHVLNEIGRITDNPPSDERDHHLEECVNRLGIPYNLCGEETTPAAVDNWNRELQVNKGYVSLFNQLWELLEIFETDDETIGILFRIFFEPII